MTDLNYDKTLSCKSVTLGHFIIQCQLVSLHDAIGHIFFDNLDLAAQFAYFRRPESLFGPYSIKNGSLFD